MSNLLAPWAEHAPRVLGDHEFFIRRYHPCRNGASRPADAGAALGIGLLVEFEAEPTRVLADARADHGRVFTDASGKDECIETAQRGRERAELELDAIDE